ncbi:hypothetical protein ACRQ5Q_14875 [Bradyrhizobium sp. PMVTL-01]|uniref:hypothetical protein n=1 Tax=Bradyrhizobium sp. PMVTL-01 TaxID=3434999 RepID=UPI003F6E45E5
MSSNVVGLKTFRAARMAREMERHFGLPEGAAEVSPDAALADFMAPHTARPTHVVVTKADLIAFAKTGGPPPRD